MAEKKTGKKTQAKSARGRPSIYAPVLCIAARAFARLGLVDEEIAHELKISTATLNNWKKEHPEFLESLKAGKDEPDDKVERSLYERATGYDHPAVKIFMPVNSPVPIYAPYTEHCPPDVTAQIFWLKNRRPERWRDKQDIDANLHTDQPFTLVLGGERPKP